MTKKHTLRCPSCSADIQEKNKHFPFCSDRCQMVDLGKWLNEEYRLPAPLTERDVGTIERLIEKE